MNKIKFTQAAIEKLPFSSDKAQQIYWDEKLPCFGVKIGRLKKSYFVQRKVDNRNIYITIGSAAEYNLERAKNEARKHLADIHSGIDPTEAARQKKENDITFGELFHKYMEIYSKPQKRSWQYDEREVNKFLSHWFKRKISTITKAEIVDLIGKISKDNGLYQSNRILERTRAIFNKAIEWGWKGENPTKGLKKFKEKSRDRFIQPYELGPFLEALSEEENKTAHDYIMISLLTGARKSNVLKMRWDQIDLENGSWSIPLTKNGNPQRIPLIDEAKNILIARKKDLDEKKKTALKNNLQINSEWVFEGSGTHGHLCDPKKSWDRIRQKATLKIWKLEPEFEKLIKTVEKNIASKNKYIFTSKKLIQKVKEKAKEKKLNLPIGILDLRIHDIRRTLGSYQAITGASLPIIGKTLGHASSQSTTIYARLNLDPVRESMEKAVKVILNK